MKNENASHMPVYDEDSEHRIETDPNGSYTGVCADDPYGEVPVQDVDDL